MRTGPCVPMQHSSESRWFVLNIDDQLQTETHRSSNIIQIERRSGDFCGCCGSKTQHARVCSVENWLFFFGITAFVIGIVATWIFIILVWSLDSYDIVAFDDFSSGN